MSLEPDLDGGFSLVETMVALVVSGLIMGALVGLLGTGQRLSAAQQDERDLRSQTRLPLSRIVREISLAGYGMQTQPEAITSAGQDVLAFVADIDNGAPAAPCTAESLTTPQPERVSYRATRGALERQVECWESDAWKVEIAWQVLTLGVTSTNPTFRFFDANGSEISAADGLLGNGARARIRAISVQLAVSQDSPATGSSSLHRALQTRIRLRNLLLGG